MQKVFQLVAELTDPDAPEKNIKAGVSHTTGQLVYVDGGYVHLGRAINPLGK